MKHKMTTLAALAGGATMLLFVSCQREEEVNEQYRPAGTEIVFGAETGYSNGLGETRTMYSGALTTTTPKYERIDWLNGDDMTIEYVRGSVSENGVYAVGTDITANAELSTAAVTHTSGTKLTWATGTGDHYFYASYPSGHISSQTVSGTIPAAQGLTYNATQGKYLPSDMSIAYMAGYKKVSSSSTENRVTIPFNPAMTAFEFILKMAAGESAVTVTKFEMTSTTDKPLTGAFSFQVTGGTDEKGSDWWNKTVGTGGTTLTGTGNHIEVTFPTGATMSSTKALDFTFFALPVALSNITVTLTLSTDGGATTFTKSLPLKDDATTFHTFAACHKHIITNSDVPGDDWQYFLDPIEDIIKYGHTAFSEGFTVHSYRTKGSTTEPVSWAIQYSADGTTWSDNPPAGSNATVTTGASPTAGYSAGHNNTTTTTIDQTGHTDILRSNTITSSATAPYDLSMHTVQGGDRTGPVTANSYVIKAPGYYMFPLVYGNSIDATKSSSIDANALNGGNKQSYAPTKAANSKTYLTPFLNVNDQGIRYPNVLRDLGIEGTSVDAVIVWQDVPSGFEIVEESSLEIIDAPSNAGVKNCKYIKFKVEQARITQGNILIALRDASDQIVWSWHIWVTDENMALIPLKNRANDWTSVMPVDVGWCDIDVTRVTKYADRDFYVRVYQTGEGTKETTFHVIQYGESTSVAARGGSSTYYQWGRKDPFLPSDGNRTSISNKNYVSNNYTITKSNIAIPTSRASQTGALSAKRAISNPHTLYYYTSYRTFLSNYLYYDYNGQEHHFTGYVPNYDKYSPLDWFDGACGGYYHENLWDTACNGIWYDENRYGISTAYPSTRATAKKSIYDPCPPGFRVPTASEFDILYTSNQNSNYGSPSSAHYVSATQHFEMYCNGINNSNGVIVIPWQSYRQGSGQDAYGQALESGGLSGLGVFHYMTSTPCSTTPNDPALSAQYPDQIGFADAWFGIDYPSDGNTLILLPLQTYPSCGAYPVRPVAE